MTLFKFLAEIARPSACRTWLERYIVEVFAAGPTQAREIVAFSLSESEQIVSCHVGQPDYLRVA